MINIQQFLTQRNDKWLRTFLLPEAQTIAAEDRIGFNAGWL